MKLYMRTNCAGVKLGKYLLRSMAAYYVLMATFCSESELR